MLGGRLDVLVNNAGAGKFDLKLADITPEDWLWHMNTNVNSVMYLTQMAIPHLEATKGSVINISSIAGNVLRRMLHTHSMPAATHNACSQSRVRDTVNLKKAAMHCARAEAFWMPAAKRAVPGAPAYAISKASCRCADHKLCPRASSSGMSLTTKYFVAFRQCGSNANGCNPALGAVHQSMSRHTTRPD